MERSMPRTGGERPGDRMTDRPDNRMPQGMTDRPNDRSTDRTFNRPAPPISDQPGSAATDRPNGSWTGEGKLIFQISTAGGAIPLPGAQITVRSVREEAGGNESPATPGSPDSSASPSPNTPSTGGGGQVLAVLYTDADGKTAPLPLPAPARSLSLEPTRDGNPVPYALYDAQVLLDNFYSQSYIRIPIFDGITSIQHASLIPLPENGNPDGARPNGERFYEGENPQL